VNFHRKKLTPVLDSPTPVSDIKMKQGECVIWIFLRINLSTTLPIKRSRPELSDDMVIHMGILKIAKLRHSLVLPSYLKHGLVSTALLM